LVGFAESYPPTPSREKKEEEIAFKLSTNQGLGTSFRLLEVYKISMCKLEKQKGGMGEAFPWPKGFL